MTEGPELPLAEADPFECALMNLLHVRPLSGVFYSANKIRPAFALFLKRSKQIQIPGSFQAGC